MTMKAITSSGLLLATAPLLACTDGATRPKASGMEFTVQPVSVAVGSPLAPAPVLVVRDEDGNVVVDWEDPVTVTLSGGGPGASLGGTSTRTPVAGTFVFDDLTISAPGDGFSLTALSGGLPQAQSVPFDVHARLASAQFTAGHSHTCALTSQGEAFCWGNNHVGQLGDGTTEERNLPVRVDTDLRFAALSAGYFYHTCGITAEGTVHCWGGNFSGTLGIGQPDGAYPLPTPVPLPGPAIMVNAGGVHTCALLEGGEVYCWGDNASGQIGVGEVGGEYSLPTPVTGGHRFETVSAGQVHTCAVTGSGVAYCWGGNRSAELGQGIEGGDHAEPIPSPAPVVGDHVFQTVVADGDYCCSRSCGLDQDGHWRCWGRNIYSHPRFWTEPTPILGDPGFQELIPGGLLMCGLPGDGTLYCLGNPEWGMMGPGYLPRGLTQLAPELVTTSVAMGSWHICISTIDEGTYCWGSNQRGQLGNPSNPSGWYVPMPVWAPAER